MSADRKVWRDKINNFLKSRAIKLALAFIGSKVSWLVSGPWGWITNLILNTLWDRFAARAIRWGLRKGALKVDIERGKLRILKINKAKNENDDDTFWDVIGSI